MRIAGTRAGTWWLAALCWACACSSSGGGDRDAAVPADAGPEDAATDGPDAGDAAPGPRTVAPPRDPEPIAVDRWMVAPVYADEDEALRRAVRDGTLELPEEGVDERGIPWEALVPEEGGSLGAWGRGLVWAIARVALDVPGDSSAHAFARVDHGVTIWTNGVPQPGDVYGSGRTRVPLAARAGDNLVAVRALGGTGAIAIEPWRTPDEAVFGLSDATAPDLVAGEQAESWIGVPVLNLTAEPAAGVVARVVGDERFAETEVAVPAISRHAVTQLAFRLDPIAPAPAAGETVPVRLEVDSPSLGFIYARTLELQTVEPSAIRRVTFRSPDDGSVQYYAVVPPAGFDPAGDYGLVLALHGAGVEASGMAAAYSPKDWAWIVAPTNRRPFGFDWEEWGRANALFALDDAMARLDADPARVHLVGHSMGGHGTWHVGITTPGRFATLGPSAGWSSLYSYGGEPRPTGAFGRARAHSDTLVYIDNLARRGAYVIHGDADDNVPVREGRAMSAAAAEVTADVVYWEEPGAGHWWDGDQAAGVDCVDWPPLFEFLETHRLDPLELELSFRSPSPTYSPAHSFVTLQSATTPYEDLVVTSELVDGELVVTTANVRSMQIDGAALRAGWGLAEVVVDGTRAALPDGPLQVGPETGKRRDQGGPFNQVFAHPFCVVVPDDDGGLAASRYADFAAYLASDWALVGNGHACVLPISLLTDDVRAERNLVYLGLPATEVGDPPVPFEWDGSSLTIDGRRSEDAALLFVFPAGERLAAVLTATEGSEDLLYAAIPFSSRAGLPDWLVWTAAGVVSAGYFDAEWRYDPALASP